jgi:hypothetical protein
MYFWKFLLVAVPHDRLVVEAVVPQATVQDADEVVADGA